MNEPDKHRPTTAELGTSKSEDDPSTQHGGDTPRETGSMDESIEQIHSDSGQEGVSSEHDTSAADADQSSLDPFATFTPSAQESPAALDRTRYTVLRPHQRGGLGQVSVALDGELHREVAFKEILPAQAENEEFRSRFLREAEITGALEHPGIVPVYSLGQYTDGRPYYVMRFIRGITFGRAIEDFHQLGYRSAAGRLQLRQLLKRFLDACNAIDYAHSRGVLHRDIKPDNVMLGPYGETLVVDWGLASAKGDDFDSVDTQEQPLHMSVRASSTTTQMGRVVGTPAYMSPEQAEGKLDQLGPHSDVFSLGATLYHILTGQAPYSGAQGLSGNAATRRVEPPRKVNPQIPRPLEAICLKSMASDPRHRYPTAQALAADVECWLADEHVDAYAEPLRSRLWRWVRHHKPLVAGTVATLLVAVASLSIGVILLSAANLREREARIAATDNLEEAQRQRARAERNYALARQAVNQYYVMVSEDTLLKQVGMQRLRDQLLRQALDYYQEFLENESDDATLPEEVAQAHYLVGQITSVIGAPDQALPHYASAEKIQLKLYRQEPGNPQRQYDYGQTLNARGAALQRMRRTDDARDAYRRAADLREGLAKKHSDNPEYARALANSLMNLGQLELRTGDFALAMPLLQRAQTIRSVYLDETSLSATTDAEPDTTQQQLLRDYGMGSYNLAVAKLSQGQLDEASSELLSAVESFEKLLRLDTDDMKNQERLAVCYRLLGDANSGDPSGQSASKYYLQSIAILETLVLRNPDVPSYKASLAGVLMNLSALHRVQMMPEDASRTLRRAVDLLRELVAENETVARYQRDLGVALRAWGDAVMAIDMENADPDLTAESLLQESKQILQSLVRQDPTHPDYTAELQATQQVLRLLETAPSQ